MGRRDTLPTHQHPPPLPAMWHANGVLLHFHHRTLDLFSFLSYLPLSQSTSLITRRLHWTASFLSLIPYHPNLWLTLVLSSGALLIPLLVSVFLSCMIQRLTKRWYSRPWTMSPSPCHFIRLSPPAVYKMYHYSTWTLSLSFCTIKTSEPSNLKSCISRSTSQSHSSLQLHRHGASQSV